MLCDYLVQILTARVYDVAQETPLEYAPKLSARLNNKLLLKRKDMQSVFSFKLRGAYNKMAQLPPDLLAQGVIAASAGNHAQGVALAARQLGTQAIIALLSVSENHAQSKSLRAFPHNDLSGEFLSETQKRRPIGKTYVLSGLQRLRSPRVTKERYSGSRITEVHYKPLAVVG